VDAELDGLTVLLSSDARDQLEQTRAEQFDELRLTRLDSVNDADWHTIESETGGLEQELAAGTQETSKKETAETANSKAAAPPQQQAPAARVQGFADHEQNGPPTVDKILLKATEHEAVITRADIMREAYRANIVVGSAAQAEALAIRAERAAVHLDTEIDKKERMEKFTTRDIYDAERACISSAKARAAESHSAVSAQTVDAACARVALEKGYHLSDEQAAAAQALCSTAGGVKVLIGDAGAGKSTTMTAVRMAYEDEGYRVLGTSTGGKASAELMNSSGIESKSIARLAGEIDTGKTVLDNKTVLIVDEAGMVGSRDMHKLMSAAEEAQAKVILVGDHKQLQPVAAGELLRDLDRETRGARIETIVRQSEKWERESVKLLGDGKTREALGAYEAQGRIHVDQTHTKAIADVAERHVDNMKEVGAENAIATAGTRLSVDQINAAVRDKLQERGEIDKGETYTTKDKHKNTGERQIEVSKNDRVLIGTTDTKSGHLNGDTGKVLDVQKDAITVKLDRNGETLRLDPKSVELRHAYAMTTHRLQGSTYQRATVMLDKNSSREMAYVQASRAKNETHFVVSRHTLGDMAQRSNAPKELRKAVNQVAESRVRAGKEPGIDREARISVAAAKDYIKGNKDHASPKSKEAAKKDYAKEVLGNAMHRSLKKENTLKYNERDGGGGDGKTKTKTKTYTEVLDSKKQETRSRAEAEAKFQREMKAWDKAAQSAQSRSGPEQSSSKGQSHESQGQGGGGKGQSQSQGMER
jgi:hypothetical protein